MRMLWIVAVFVLGFAIAFLLGAKGATSEKPEVRALKPEYTYCNGGLLMEKAGHALWYRLDANGKPAPC